MTEIDAAPHVVAAVGLVITAIPAGDTTSTTLLLFGVLTPLADLFWWILAATGACLLLGLLRARRSHPKPAPRAPRRGSGAG